MWLSEGDKGERKYTDSVNTQIFKSKSWPLSDHCCFKGFVEFLVVTNATDTGAVPDKFLSTNFTFKTH